MSKLFENPKLEKLLGKWEDDLQISLTKLLLELLNDVKTRPSLLANVDIDLEEDYQIKVEFSDSAKWVEWGRRAGAKLPPVQMILGWLIKYKITSSNSNQSQLQLAWKISMSIAKNGITPKPFFNKAVIITEQTTLFAISELAAFTIDAILEDF